MFSCLDVSYVVADLEALHFIFLKLETSERRFQKMHAASAQTSKSRLL